MTPPSPSPPAFAPTPVPEAYSRSSVDELYREGFVAEWAGQTGLAAAFFGEVRRRQPENPYVLPDLARVYFQLLEFERGKPLLEEASRHAGRDPEFWTQIGVVWQDARFEAEAERAFLLARHHGGGNPGFSVTLAAYYESRGRLDQAKAALERVRRKGLTGGPIRAMEGIVALRGGDRSAAIKALTACLPEMPDGHLYKNFALYALARALAETGEEAASLERLREAKARQAGRPEAQRYAGRPSRVMEEASEVRAALESTDIRAAWRAEARGQEDHPPLVFLLGYPRSGTTLLEQVVGSHPRILGYEETTAFNQALQKVSGAPVEEGEKPWDRFNASDPSARRLARAWYFEHLRRLGPPPAPGAVLLDKNPALTGNVHLISRLFPEAKFLFMVRDPRDVCLSAYQTYVTMSPFSVRWLDWDDTVRHCAEILGHWVALRDRLPNPYLEVRYEDLVTDLPATGRRVMEFLGLDWEPRQEDFARQARAKQVYSPTLYDVRRGLSPQARGKWRRFGMDYSAGQPALDPLLERFGYAGAPSAGNR